MTQLVRYEAACRALAECNAIDEVKSWQDKAAAMQAYGRMAKDKTLEVDAAEIRIRAERRLGEMLSQQRADGGLSQGARMAGGGKDGAPVVVRDDRRPKLADAGISKDLSSRAQKLAAVPEAEFEANVGEWRERVSLENARVTARLEKAGERAQKQEPSPDESGQSPPSGDDEPTLEQIVDELQRENEELSAQIKALTADDTKAELAKQIALRQGIESRLSGEMEKCKQLRGKMDGYRKWYAELRKLTGL